MRSEEHDHDSRRALVIGYGNTLRGDDGAGPLVARTVDAWGLPHVRCIEAVQLTAEMADDVGKHYLVLFVDAVSVDLCPNVRIDRLQVSDRERAIAGAMGHAGDPLGILDMAEALRGKCPEAWMIAIPAHTFDLGEHLSTATQENVERALFRIRPLLESKGHSRSTAMHEFGLAENTLAIAVDQAREKGAAKIHQVRMQIGALSGVEDEAFEFAFEALAEGTIAEGAQLVIQHVPISCFCKACGREFETGVYAYRCPICGEASSDIRRGREMNLVSMEVT